MQCLYYPQISANPRSMPSHFITEISGIAYDLCQKIIGDVTVIQKALESSIKEKCPELLDLGTNIVRILDSQEGFVVVKNLPFLLYNRPVTDMLFLALIAALGKLTVHDDSKKLIWDVTPRSQSNGRALTFSELNGEAALHTDSAFRQEPEEYFGLMAIKAAKTGGNSVVLQAEKVIHLLEKSNLGSQCLAVLRSEPFPFRVPPAFANNEQGQIIQAPILGDYPLIRFRMDTMLAGFQSYPELVTPQRLWALNYFNNFIESCPDKFELKLNDGDIILINNHTMLHGRTTFQDSNRLLLRARVRKNALS